MKIIAIKEIIDTLPKIMAPKNIKHSKINKIKNLPNVCKYFLRKYKNKYIVVIRMPIDALIKCISFFVKTQTEYYNNLIKSWHNSIP